MTAVLVLAAALAAGFVRLLLLAVPPTTDLAAEVGRWDSSRGRAAQRATRSIAGPGDRRIWTTAIAERVRTSKPAQASSFDADLAITESTWDAWLTKTLILVVAGLFAPPVLALVGASAGLDAPLALAVIAGFALGGLMVALSVGDVRSAARRRREEFRRGLSIYLDLVAMSMEAGRGHAEALPASAEVGSGWVFTEIQDAIEGARYSGVTAWEGLGRIGQRYRLPELIDLRATMALAHDDGAKVKATLVARAETLRHARLADALARANSATEGMRHLIVLMAMVVVAYEIVPQLMRLFTS